MRKIDTKSKIQNWFLSSFFFSENDVFFKPIEETNLVGDYLILQPLEPVEIENEQPAENNSSVGSNDEIERKKFIRLSFKS